MKSKLLLVSVAFFSLLTFSMLSTSCATLVTFDDLSETGSGSFIFGNYQGLGWDGVLAHNAILATNLFAGWIPNLTNGLTGDYYGMVSLSNVAAIFGSNDLGPNSEVDSPGTNFNFLSAYLTGTWNSNVNIEVQGFRGGLLLYDQTVVASATNPTLFTFNYLNIDRLYFDCFGGQPAFGVQGNDYLFTMDNFSFEFVPEPSTVLLTAAGALLLWPFVKRKRV